MVFVASRWRISDEELLCRSSHGQVGRMRSNIRVDVYYDGFPRGQ
jgi:hypothetical protein